MIRTGDNIEWTYNLTVPAGETVRLANFTILSTTRAEAEAAANALVTSSGFGGQAAAFLTPQELASLANFDNTPPTADIVDVAPDPRTTAVASINIVFSEPVYGLDWTDLTLTRNAALVPLSARPGPDDYRQHHLDGAQPERTDRHAGGNATTTYRLTLTAAGSGITDAAGNALTVDASDAWVLDTMSVDLLPESDTGISSTDNLTRLDNSTAAHALQFEVFVTNPGATVTVYADGIAIGSATASGIATVVTTNGSRDLAEGTHTITARQTEPGGSESADSPALSITVDTVAPTFPVAPDLQVASDTGVSHTDNVTSDATPTFDVGRTPTSASIATARQSAAITRAGPATRWPRKPTAPTSTRSVPWTRRGTSRRGATAWWSPSTPWPPRPRSAPWPPILRLFGIHTIDFAFSERVFGVGLPSLMLARDGGGNLLAPPGQTVTSPTGDNIQFRLSGLMSVTDAPGHYVLTLAGAGSGISDRAGNLLVTGGVEDWTTLPTTFSGTSGDDLFVFSTDGTTHRVTVTLAGGSPVHYTYTGFDPLALTFNGLDGNDKIAITGGPGMETANIYRYAVDIAGPGYHLLGSGLETIAVDAGAGTGQKATLYNGPAPGDFFTASVGLRTGSMVGTGAGNVYSNSVKNFDLIYGLATGGGANARANLCDSNGNDYFVSKAGTVTAPYSYIQKVSGGLAAPTAYVYAGFGFTTVYGYSTSGGNDEAVLHGSNGDDVASFQPQFRRAYIIRPGSYFIFALDFKTVTAYPEDGANDQAYLYDTSGDDTFTASPADVQMTGTIPGLGVTYRNVAAGWDKVYGLATNGGLDKAYLAGSSGDDTFVGYGGPRSGLVPGAAYLGKLSGLGYYVEVQKFEEVYADLKTGHDAASLYDSTGDDTFWGKLAEAVLSDGALNSSDGSLVTPKTYYYKVYGFNGPDGDRVQPVRLHRHTRQHEPEAGRLAAGLRPGRERPVDRSAVMAIGGRDSRESSGGFRRPPWSREGGRSAGRAPAR